VRGVRVSLGEVVVLKSGKASHGALE
jgi:hypothetical protein